MTLSSFKKRGKFTFLIFLLISYGFLSFGLGLAFNFGIVNKVKHALSVKRPESPNKSAYAAPIESPLPYSDQQSGEVIGSYIKLCSNATYSFQVSYPKEWFTTYNDDKEKCTYFAPFSFTVFADPSANDVPIKVEIVKPGDWQSTVRFYENPNDFQNVLATQNIEINGTSVEKITSQTTGKENLTRGFAKVSYLIFNARLPLVFTYQQLSGKENPQDYQKVLEDMVRSLEYF